MPELFSFYRNGVNDKMPYRQYDIVKAVELIKNGAFAEDIARLRNATDPSTQKVIKNGLSYFTFSGTFTKREEAGLIEHSGLLTLDFDDLKDLSKSKQQLIALPFTAACFTSPRGNGLKAIVRINSAQHAETFVALEKFFLDNYKIELDTSGIDVTRTCFVSHDPDIYYNPDAAAYLLSEQELHYALERLKPVSMKPKLTDTAQQKALKLIEYVVSQIEEQGADLTDDYQDWLYMGFALSTLGDEGRDFYHRISQFNSNYSVKEVNYKFSNYLRLCRFTTPAKFFDIAKAHGMEITMPKKHKEVVLKPSHPQIIEQENTIPGIAEAIKVTVDYVLLNESHGEPIFLVTYPGLIEELKQKDYPNILYGIQRFNDSVASKLRAISNNVRLVTRDPEQDLDTCDMFVAKRFSLSINTIADESISYKDYLIKHYTEHHSKDKIAENMQPLCEHISYYTNAFERDAIAASVAKIAKTSKSTVLKAVNDFISHREGEEKEIEENEDALPKWINVDRFWRYGFDWKVDTIEGTGIYFNEYGKPKRLTNFVLNPLIHIYTKDEGNRRLTELQNGYNKTVIELPTKAFTSMEAFENIVSSEGAFFTLDGFSKSHLNKLKAYYLGEYPKCYELNTLGWQPEGFFSFANLIYNNKTLIEYNPYGFADIEGTNFLSMAASNVLSGVRGADDAYKKDRYLEYIKTDLTLNRWSDLMTKVYPDHGMLGVAFAVMTAFRDVIFERDNNFPLLYPYGVSQAGKSKFAESICNLYTHQMPMFNLNQGTDPAFFRLLGQYFNVPVGMNEFDENAIADNRFRAFKAAYDGEGRQKTGALRNKTIEQEINNSIIIIGQYLSNKDDNAVVNRALPCKFSENNNRTPEQIAWYDELKGHERKGISSLVCDILDQREHMIANYKSTYTAVAKQLTEYFNTQGIKPKNRVMQNYGAALTTIKLLAERLDLAFTYEQFFAYVAEEIHTLSGVLLESNSLGQFWKTVEFLLDQNLIESNWQFKVVTETEVKVTDGRDEHGKQVKRPIVFAEPKKLLYLRLNTVHTLYMKEIRSQTGKAGQNEQTILTYLKDQPYYIGSNPSSAFKDKSGNKKTTCSYVFDYDMLGVTLETYREEETDPTVTIEGQLWQDAEIADVLGIPKLKFTLWKDESYDSPDGRVKNEVFTQCLSDDTKMVTSLKRFKKVKLTGALNVAKGGHRRMAVYAIEMNEEFTATELPEGEAGF